MPNVQHSENAHVRWLQVGDVQTFKSTPLKRTEIEQILAAAALAPSAANVQPWEFIAITDAHVKAKLAALAQEPFLREAAEASWLAEAPVLVVACLDRLRAKARFGELGEKLIGIQDVAIAIHLTRIRAQSMGIGSTWVREFDLQGVAELLSLPSELVPQAVLAFGYTAERPQRTPQLQPTDFVRWVDDKDKNQSSEVKP